MECWPHMHIIFSPFPNHMKVIGKRKFLYLLKDKEETSVDNMNKFFKDEVEGRVGNWLSLRRGTSIWALRKEMLTRKGL